MVTQYVNNSGMTTSVAGWTRENCTLTATSDGGKVRAADYARVNYEIGSAHNGKKLVTGARYTLNGLKIRRDHAETLSAFVIIAADNSLTQFDVDLTHYKVGEWVQLPNISVPSGITSDHLKLTIGADAAGTGRAWVTLTHCAVYRITEVPDQGGPVKFNWDGPTITFNKVAFTEKIIGAWGRILWSWGGAGTGGGYGDPDGDGADFVSEFTYTNSGTYTITGQAQNLVNGAWTTYATKSVTVTVEANPAAGVPAPLPPPAPIIDPEPVFAHFSDRIRLEVQDFSDLPPGVYRNLIENTDGSGGGYGWVTPYANTWIGGANEPYTREVQGLLYHAAPAVKSAANNYVYNAFATEYFPITEGWYLRAAWETLYVGNYYRPFLDVYDENFQFLGNVATGAWGSSLGDQVLGGQIYDWGDGRARYGQFGFVCASLDPAVEPWLSRFLADNWRMALRNVMVTCTPTDPGALEFADNATAWRNILGPTNTLQTRRAALDVGSLSATILDAALDPALSPSIRPGGRVRLRAWDTDRRRWHSLISGTIDDGTVVYERGYKNEPGNKGARITLTATDPTQRLANAPRPESVPNISDLPYVLEGAGVPWVVNDNSNQLGTDPLVVALNPNATALDQVALTRDSNRGYAWLDGTGTLRAYDADQMPADPVGTLDETVYRDVDVSFDTRACINEVTVKFLRYKPVAGVTEEVTYGPYRDQDSIDQWGRYSAEFTIGGPVESEQVCADFAQEVLAANSVPERSINSLTLPVRDESYLVKGRALVDLYDLVTTDHAATGTSHAQRVTSIEHTITATRDNVSWGAAVGFSTEGAVASPRQLPAPGRSSTAVDEPEAPPVAAGRFTCTVPAINTTYNQVIDFATPFAAPPIVIPNPEVVAGVEGAELTVRATNITAVRFTLQWRRTDGATNFPCGWIATPATQ